MKLNKLETQYLDTMSQWQTIRHKLYPAEQNEQQQEEVNEQQEEEVNEQQEEEVNEQQQQADEEETLEPLETFEVIYTKQEE